MNEFVKKICMQLEIGKFEDNRFVQTGKRDLKGQVGPFAVEIKCVSKGWYTYTFKKGNTICEKGIVRC